MGIATSVCLPCSMRGTCFENAINMSLCVAVVLSAPSSRSFEGFLLQAREVGSTTAVGSFITKPKLTQTLSCGGTAVSMMHPNTNQDIILRIHATFVEGFNKYWVAVASPLVKFTSAGSNSTEEASTPANTGSGTCGFSGHFGRGCGESKVCFREPSDCDPAQDINCFFLSAVLVSPGSSAVLFQLSGPSDGYISFGFSNDQEMRVCFCFISTGDDDIYICVVDSSGRVQLRRAFSTGRTTPQSVPLGNVSDVKTSVQNNIIRCSFTSTNSISTRMSRGSTQRSRQRYYLLYAHGPSHNGKIYALHPSIFFSQRPHIIKAHGALMLVAWMTTGTLGMMVARFNKGLAKGHTLCGKDLWFVLHVSMMCVTVAATIIAFILAFSYARTWSGSGAHPVLGCLVMILSLLQPLGALLRCGPQHPKRFLFNWSHALNALAIKALSVAAIFTGLKLIDSSESQWLMKVMGGFVGWEAVYFGLSDLNLRWTDKSEGRGVYGFKYSGEVSLKVSKTSSCTSLNNDVNCCQCLKGHSLYRPS
uniref:Ferric-chelate reductase 1 n=1 Tax=Neogobius melanostomus TaxID=47308 RepID=A0A8C6TU01_9GOBI